MSTWKSSSKKGKRHSSHAKPGQGDSRAIATRASDGRLHLVLHSPAQPNAHVTLRQPLFAEAWQNALTESVANTALSALREGVVQEAAVELAREAMDATSRLAEGLLARAANGAVACRSGCAHCCYQSVGVTAVEALAIADHLKRTRSPEALAQVSTRLAHAREQTAGLTAAERNSPEYPCPFLEQAVCSIYEVRPLSCRGMNALDAEECRRNLHDPVARAAFLESGVGASVFMEPIRAFHAVSAGLQLGLSELYHLDMRPLDLTAVMSQLLNGPPALSEAWLRGEPAFEAALGGDSTHEPRAQEITGAMRNPTS